MTPADWIAAGNIPSYYTRTPGRQKKWAGMDEAGRLKEAAYEIQTLKDSGQFNPDTALQNLYASPQIQPQAPTVTTTPQGPCSQYQPGTPAYNRCMSLGAAGMGGAGVAGGGQGITGGQSIPGLMIDQLK